MPDAFEVADGTWVSIDVGTVRVGVAATDPERRMAFPVETVPRNTGAIGTVLALGEDRGAVAYFVGLPKTMAGGESASAADAREFARAIAEHTEFPVRLIDERLTTATASASLRQAGRTSRQQRAVIDQAAAVVILELALDGVKNGVLDTLTELVTRKGSYDGSV